MLSLWLFHAVTIRVELTELMNEGGVGESHSIYLVSQGYPVGLDVVRASKQLDLACARREAFNDAVNLVGLVARGPHLRHDHITVQTPVHFLQNRTTVDNLPHSQELAEDMKET